jgi:hypothetical protein
MFLVLIEQNQKREALIGQCDLLRRAEAVNGVGVGISNGLPLQFSLHEGKLLASPVLQFSSSFRRKRSRPRRHQH